MSEKEKRDDLQDQVAVEADEVVQVVDEVNAEAEAAAGEAAEAAVQAGEVDAEPEEAVEPEQEDLSSKESVFERAKKAAAKARRGNQAEDGDETVIGKADEDDGKEPSEKRKVGPFKRWQVTVIVVAVIVAIAGGAFWVWHETPGFCDAICHDPQDPYNPTYYAEPGASATDKWGNEVEDASSMLSATHRAYGNLACMDCHVPSIVEQVTEGFRWMAGDFYSPLSERSLENLVAYRAKGTTAEEFCMNENCHNLTKTELKEATSNIDGRNPHEFHHTEYDCGDCHKSHRASIMVCTECHSDAVAPEGWLTAQEAKKLGTIYGAYDTEKIGN